MEVNFVDENAWKNKDIALAYQYTTGSSPAIEKDKATFKWYKDGSIKLQNRGSDPDMDCDYGADRMRRYSRVDHDQKKEIKQ